MATAAVIPGPQGPEVQNRHVIHRQTRGGRTLWYQLTVLQQPERARACGAGTRANSDRRPVDPPPVVELKIAEGGNSFEEGRDITFDYNASFFLYASLEQCRKLVRGRVQGQPNPPILTGVPASGMAYLDRPNQAGYFIFPDLSVRHEGYYKLAFSLFETTKEEKDFDIDMEEMGYPVGVDWRMEIKTSPFEVYSAKKFPGLKESTDLSKQVAEQGCRVRIRREIRMRKRDNKGNGRGRREEEISARRTVTPSEDPSVAAARARSLSNSSEHRPVYPNDAQRRPSAADPYGVPPPAPQSHLSFGNAVPQYAAPPAPAPPSHHQNIPSMSPRHAPGLYSRPEPQSYSAGYMPQDQAGQYHQQIPRAMHPSPSPGLRHTLPSPSSYSSGGHSRRDSQASYPTTPGSSYGHRMPPIHSAPPSRVMSIDAMVSKDQQEMGPNMISESHKHLEPIQPETEPPQPPRNIRTGEKRAHDETFAQDSRPLHGGQRPRDTPTSHFSRNYYDAGPEWGTCMDRNGRIMSVNFPKLTYGGNELASS